MRRAGWDAGSPSSPTIGIAPPHCGDRLQVRRRLGRKRAVGTRAPMALPQGPNQRWSLDFLSDAFADCRRFRILAIVDDFTRECLTLSAKTRTGYPTSPTKWTSRTA